MTMHSARRRAAAIASTLALAVTGLAPAAAQADIQINADIAAKVLAKFSCNAAPSIAGTAGNDVLNGTAAADVIHGYAGADQIMGKESNDKICAGEGSDHGLYGQAGNDVIRGGQGNDTDVTGNEGDDWVFGDYGNDVLGAHPGKDAVYGGADSDTLYGDTWPVGGNDPTDKDYLDGGPGYDTCYPGFEDTVKNCENVVWPPQPPA